MTHDPNPLHLPPARSAGEYEREIDALKAQVAALRDRLVATNYAIREASCAAELPVTLMANEEALAAARAEGMEP